jgi:hypothetical protein
LTNEKIAEISIDAVTVTLVHRYILSNPPYIPTLPEVNDIVEVDAMFAESVDTWTEKWKMEGIFWCKALDGKGFKP